MSDQILWFATRGAGVVSLLLLTSVTCLGMLTVVRWQSPSWPRFLTAGLHRNLALLSLAFLGVHIATAIVDPFTSLGIVAAAIPFASSYRPLWVGLGVIAIDLLLAIAATSLLRERIGQRAWRAIHWASYAAWPLAVAHGFGAGSDAFAPWLLAIQVACIGAVAAALAWRISAGGSNRSRLPGLVAGTAARAVSRSRASRTDLLRGND
jgi:methionine sulfoxide reductase heme-binding subunit